MEILTDDLREMRKRLTRRAFLGRSAAGLGSLALGLLLDPKARPVCPSARYSRAR